MSSPLSDLSPASPVRFGNRSAYAFDGDFVHLQAELMVTPQAPSAAAWSLQLWADAGSEAAIKLAEVELDALVPDDDGRTHVNAMATALPPAGSGEHHISLLLAERKDASVNVVDAVSYPRNERFVLPRLDGEVTQRFDGDQVEVHVQRILNPRPADNVSGTLALELWALPAPYRGGAFSGISLGAIVIGSLPGQTDRLDTRWRLPVAPLPTGTWHPVLMLREWTPAGYLTRDYRQFAPQVAQGATVVAVPPTTPATRADAATAAAPTAEMRQGEKAVARRRSAAAAEAPARPSINRASAAELALVRGLSLRLAEAIVAGRPWAAVDDLLAVKGIGPKLLERLRGQLQG